MKICSMTIIRLKHISQGTFKATVSILSGRRALTRVFCASLEGGGDKYKKLTKCQLFSVVGPNFTAPEDLVDQTV